MNLKVIVTALIFGMFFFIGMIAGSIITKKVSISIASCNIQLHKMQSYYLDNIYHKFGVKEAKDERKNIKQYCYINNKEM